MLRWIEGALCAVVLAAAAPAHADGMDHFWIGLNGVLTAPADPVLGFTDPPARYDRLPLHEVTGRVVGLADGLLLGAYRAASGLLDIATTPLWVMPDVSPQARLHLVVGTSGVSASGGVKVPFAPGADGS